MGMAASQARYLGLTARKTNVEYEGQQINQARTALSNQSANLWNQMLAMSVPTPPDTTDYTKVQYAFSDGVNNYEITNMLMSDEKDGYNYQITYRYFQDALTGIENKNTNPQVDKLSTGFNDYMSMNPDLYADYITSKISSVAADSKSGIISDNFAHYEIMGTDVDGNSISGNYYKLSDILKIRGYNSTDAEVMAAERALADAKTAMETDRVNYSDALATSNKALWDSTAAPAGGKTYAETVKDNSAAKTAMKDYINSMLNNADINTAITGSGIDTTAYTDAWTAYENDKTSANLIAAQNESANLFEQLMKNEAVNKALFAETVKDKPDSDLMTAKSNFDKACANSVGINEAQRYTRLNDSDYTDALADVVTQEADFAESKKLVAEAEAALDAARLESQSTLQASMESALEVYNALHGTHLTLDTAYANLDAVGTSSDPASWQIMNGEDISNAQYALDNGYKTMNLAHYSGADRQPAEFKVGNAKAELYDPTDIEQRSAIEELKLDYPEVFTDERIGANEIYTFEKNGQRYFCTQTDLETSFNNHLEHSEVTDVETWLVDSGRNSEAGSNSSYLDFQYPMYQYYATDIKEEIIQQSYAMLDDVSGSGRYSSIKLENSSATFVLETETVTNEQAYNDAMNQYNYNLAVYEKNLADINAKTKVIQEQDRTLELRLKQLDTEQKALTTEMEAVAAVIKKNVESTFKTFAS